MKITSENAHLVATFNSLTARDTSTAVCSTLYSTLSSRVPWSITMEERSLNNTARSAMDLAICESSRSRCLKSG